MEARPASQPVEKKCAVLLLLAESYRPCPSNSRAARGTQTLEWTLQNFREETRDKGGLLAEDELFSCKSFVIPFRNTI